MNDIKERLYTPKTIQKLGLIGYKSMSSIRGLIKSGKLESINVSDGKRGTYFIKESAICRFLNNRINDNEKQIRKEKENIQEEYKEILKLLKQ